MPYRSMFLYFWVKCEWLLLANLLDKVLPVTEYIALNTATLSPKRVYNVICFAIRYKWFNLKENQQIFWLLFHCFLGRKIIFQVEVIAYLYHLCFELPSTGNCRYPWQQHIHKCDKLKCISGFWRGGLLLLKNISPMSLHYTKVIES